MKASEVFREAAKLIEIGNAVFCCDAVSAVVFGTSYLFFPCQQREYFKSIYGKQEGTMHGWYGSTRVQKNQDARVIALCLAAAVAESEGK